MAKRDKSRKAAKPAALPPVSRPAPAAAPAGPPPAVDQGMASRLGPWFVPLVLVGLAIVAYLNSFQGAFMLDDRRLIVDNWRIHRLGPPFPFLVETDRPVSRLTLAINYALGGVTPWGYHAFNLAVHALAGLLLYGVVRRTLDSGNLRARYEGVASWLAAAVAALWLVHPLQTESVTYVIQRDESLMGCFVLLMLYAAIRAHASRHAILWSVLAVAACSLGMGTKQVMVTAPVLVVLYDRAFLFPSLREALAARFGLYAALAATWGILAFVLLGASQQPMSALGAGTEKITAWHYLLTQAGVIVHYLRLSMWPAPLVLDYQWPVATSIWDVVPQAVVLVAALAATVLAFRRAPGLAFLGVWFFLILAPTSSIIPIADPAFEHRMYLPLAAVVVAAVLGAYELLALAGRRGVLPAKARASLGFGLLAVVVAALVATSIRRNEDYHSTMTMWTDVVAKRPENSRARNNLGAILTQEGRNAEAEAQLAEAVRLKPDYANAHNSLGMALANQNRVDEAIVQYREAIRLNPRVADPRLNLGAALIAQGALEEAKAELAEALRVSPDYANAHYNLGIALERSGKVDEAAERYREAIRLDPEQVGARLNLGAALVKRGRAAEASALFAEVARIRPGGADVHSHMGSALAAEGKLDAAIREYELALKINPRYAEAENNLGAALHRQGKVKEAIAHFTRAVEFDPGYAVAHNNLGAALGGEGRLDEATREFAAALAIKPDFTEARNNLQHAQSAAAKPVAPR